jgi:hypothetical protein
MINRYIGEACAKPEDLCAQGYFNGRTCRIRVTLREYEGEMRSGIAGLMPAAGGAGDGFFKG